MISIHTPVRPSVHIATVTRHVFSKCLTRKEETVGHKLQLIGGVRNGKFGAREAERSDSEEIPADGTSEAFKVMNLIWCSELIFLEKQIQSA